MCTFTTPQTTILTVRQEAKAKTDGPVVQQALAVNGYISIMIHTIQLYNWCTTNKSCSKYQGKLFFSLILYKLTVYYV